MLFAPLATPQLRWKAFLTGWGIQAIFVLAALVLNALFPQQVQQVKKYVVTSLVVPVEPVTTEAQPVNPRLHVLIKPSPAALSTLETPAVAKLLVPPQPRKLREPEPDIKAPEVTVESKTAPILSQMPNAAPPKVIATNTFGEPSNLMPTTTKPAAQVQTGGFGDPSGVSACPTCKGATNIATRGNPGLPSGSGFGNGFGGAKGVAGVGIVGNGRVQSSGFDKQPAAPRNTEVQTAVTAATPVEIISKPKPVYTEEGRMLKVEGEVQLEVQFLASGQTHVLRIVRGLGHGLDEQAVKVAEQIRFRPAQHEGQPVDSQLVVHIIFELAS